MEMIWYSDTGTRVLPKSADGTFHEKRSKDLLWEEKIQYAAAMKGSLYYIQFDEIFKLRISFKNTTWNEGITRM